MSVTVGHAMRMGANLSPPVIQALASDASDVSGNSIFTNIGVTTRVDGLVVVAARCNGDRASTMTPSVGTFIGSMTGITTHAVGFSGGSAGGTLLLWSGWASNFAGSVGTTWSSNSAGRAVSTMLVTGASGVVQAQLGAGSTSGTTYSVTLPSTPARTSLLIGAITAQDTGGITPTTVFAFGAVDELHDLIAGTDRALETQAVIIPGSVTVSWGDLTDGLRRRGAVIEVAS